MDKRKAINKKVKKAITDTVFSLMQEKSLSEISITEIANTANVSRSSFYRNYSSKEDVLVTLVRDVLDDFRDSADYNLSDVYSKKHIKRTISCFYDNRSYVLNLYRSGYGTMLLNELNQFHESIAGDMNAHSKDRYSLYIYIGAMYNTALIYLTEENPSSIDEITDVLYNSLNHL